MKLRRYRAMIVIAALVLAAVAQAGWKSRVERAIQTGDYSTAEQVLNQRLQRHASDPYAQRELGVVLLKQGRFSEAEEHLRWADQARAKDERTLLYLGLSLEQQHRYREAKAVYASLETPVLRARLAQTEDRVLREAVEQALSEEQEGKKLGIITQQQDSSIAATEFSTSGLADSLRPLGRGMSALLSSDLSRLTPFHVLERTRLQPLFDELKLRNFELTDATGNEAIGKIAGVERVCTGRLEMTDHTLVAHGQLVEVPDGEPQFAGTADGQLETFYLVEKRLLEQILGALGVSLSGPQQRMLARVPTHSLAALLAYSEGLEFWDRGQAENALTAFQRATALDPGFELARWEFDWRRIAAEHRDNLSDYEDLSDATVAPTPETPGSRLVMRDWLTNANPNAIEWRPTVTELDPPDPRDLPYGDQAGQWILIQIQPQKP